jgi:hypothetical protein
LYEAALSGSRGVQGPEGLQGEPGLSSEVFTLLNLTGSTLPKGTPVTTDSNGNLSLIDVSNEAQVMAIAGIVFEDIPNNTLGDIIESGLVYQYVTSFVLSDVVYLSKTGGLTNIIPAVGVGGFVRGDFDIANYDALLNAWSQQAVQPNVTLGVGNTKYSSAGAAARLILTSAPHNWTINDGGEA